MPAVHRPVRTAARFRAAFGDETVRYAAAVGSGLTRSELRAALDRGLLSSPRRGLIRVAGVHDVDTAHVVAVRAALLAVGSQSYACDHSAALLHRLPLIRPLPAHVALLVPGRSSFRGPGLVARGIALPEDQRAEVDGMAATGLLRTGIDLARRHHVPSGLIPLDAAARRWIQARTRTSGNALRRAVRDRAQRDAALTALDACVAACAGQHGIPAVRRALPFVDPAAESLPESRSRGWLIEAGLGPIEVGYPVDVGPTTYWADLAVPERRLLFEVDGWVKYGDSASTVRASLGAERERQRRLERRGWRIVRWASDERRDEVVGRVVEALRHG